MGGIVDVVVRREKRERKGEVLADLFSLTMEFPAPPNSVSHANASYVHGATVPPSGCTL